MTQATSRQAFLDILNSGALGASQKKVFETIFEAGAATGRELNDKLKSQSAHKRLSELQDMGLIREKGVRPCAVTGHDAVAWEITGSMPRKVTPVVNDVPTKKEIEEAVEKIRGLTAYYKRQNPSWEVPEALIKVGLWLRRRSR